MTDRPSEDVPSLLDLLDLPVPLQALVRWLRQQPPVTLAQIADHLQTADPTADQAANQVATLIARGYVDRLPADPAAPDPAAPRYRLRHGHRTGRSQRSRLWDSLDDSLPGSGATRETPPADLPPSGLPPQV